MSFQTPELRKSAESLILSEDRNQHLHDGAVASFDFIKLRPPLIGLMGGGGFRMLMANALSRSQRETPWLREVACKSDGSFDGLEQACAKISSDESLKSHVDLLTHIIVMLVNFIGPGMTRAILLDTFPHLKDNDVTSLGMSDGPR